MAILWDDFFRKFSIASYGTGDWNIYYYMNGLSLWDECLGGGLKQCLFSPRKLGKISHFDYNIFQMG